MDLPQTFNIIPNCSKCQKRVKKIFSTLIGSVNSIEVENKGNAGGRVIVKSKVDPVKFAIIIEELLKGNFNACGDPMPLPTIDETNSYSRTPSLHGNNRYMPNMQENNRYITSMQGNNNRHTPIEQENNSHVSVGQSILKGHQGIEQLQDLVKNKKIKQLELVQNLRINFSEEKDNEPSQKGSECDNKGNPQENILKEAMEYKGNPQEHKSKPVIGSNHQGPSNATNMGDNSKGSDNTQAFYTNAHPPPSVRYNPSPPRANDFSGGSRCNML